MQIQRQRDPGFMMTKITPTNRHAALLFAILFLTFEPTAFADNEIVTQQIQGDAENSTKNKVADGCADDLNPEALKAVNDAYKKYSWKRPNPASLVKSIEDGLTKEPRIYLGYDALKVHYCWYKKSCGHAVSLYKKAIDACPDFSNHHFSLGEIYARMGKHQDAIESYLKAQEISKEERTSYAYMKIADSYRKLKSTNKSIENYQTSVALNERNFIARRRLIILLFVSKKNDEAIAQTETLLALKPDARTRSWANKALKDMLKRKGLAQGKTS